MQILPSHLSTQLQRGFNNIDTLHGDEALLVQQPSDLIRTTARSQN